MEGTGQGGGSGVVAVVDPGRRKGGGERWCKEKNVHTYSFQSATLGSGLPWCRLVADVCHTASAVGAAGASLVMVGKRGMAECAVECGEAGLPSAFPLPLVDAPFASCACGRGRCFSFPTPGVASPISFSSWQWCPSSCSCRISASS